MSDKPKVTALICALDEEDNLKHVIPRIPDWVDEVMLVDGHSTDNTVEVAKTLRPDINVVTQLGRGKGDALRCGIENSVGDIIVTLDADGATDPEEIPKFIEPLFNGYDYAKGSRFRGTFPRNKPWYRILGNWAITVAFDALFIRAYTDLCSGYNAFWKKAVESRSWPSDGFENEPLINCWVAKNGLRVKEIGHADAGRVSGEIKELAWRQGFKAIKTIIRERFRG
jgi:glycosyltransferase involved in cell wall biosynthesis